VCIDLAEWAERNKYTTLLIGPPVASELIDFIDESPEIKYEYKLNSVYLNKSHKLVFIENAIIRDEVGFLELPDGQLCFEGNWYLKHLTDHPAYQRRFNYKKRYLKGNWYSLLSLWGPMYYHWFHDVLPRLENALEYLPNDTRFLINKTPFEYQIKSLEAYGISPDRLEYQAPQLHTKVQNLWFATPIGHEKLGSITTILKVVKRLKSYFGVVANKELQTKVYISRKNAISRRVLNEDEVSKIALDKGYHIYNIDESPWIEQLVLFNNSISILGPHGGGFTNMIFSNKKMNIYEIDPPNHSWPYYQFLSAQLGNSFIRINAKTDSDGNRANIFADLDDLANKAK
jgi:hypothetical protein